MNIGFGAAIGDVKFAMTYWASDHAPASPSIATVVGEQPNGNDAADEPAAQHGDGCREWCDLGVHDHRGHRVERVAADGWHRGEQPDGSEHVQPVPAPVAGFGAGRGVSGDGQRSGQHAAASRVRRLVGEPERGHGGELRCRGCGGVSNEGTALFLPVTSSSNKVPTVWSTTGLSIGPWTDTAPTPDVVYPSIARADGPVYAWVWWMNGTIDPDTGEVTPPPADCPSVAGSR